MWSIGFSGHILMENTSSGGFSLALAHNAEITQQFLAECLDSSRMANIFTVFEFAGPLYLECFQAKVQVMPHTNLATLPLPIAAVKYIPKACCPYIISLSAF
jgi:hypothetical protein